MSKNKMSSELYGALLEDGEIYVNVPLLYKHSKSEEAFIENFSKIITHELLHREIKSILSYDDERIVDEISGSNNLNLLF